MPDTGKKAVQFDNQSGKTLRRAYRAYPSNDTDDPKSWQVSFSPYLEEDEQSDDYKKWIEETSGDEYATQDLESGTKQYLMTLNAGGNEDLRWPSILPADSAISENEILKVTIPTDGTIKLLCECSGKWWVCSYDNFESVDCSQTPPCEAGEQIR